MTDNVGGSSYSPRHDLGHGNVEGSAFGERGISKRLETLSGLGPLEGNTSSTSVARVAPTRCARPSDSHTWKRFDVEPKRLSIFADRLAGSPLSDRVGLSLASAETMPYRTDTFDVVTAIEVLEHIPDRGARLRTGRPRLPDAAVRPFTGGETHKAADGCSRADASTGLRLDTPDRQ
ncbi:MAG: methyltransferase domain-containing protein [Actinomycetota bacterium]